MQDVMHSYLKAKKPRPMPLKKTEGKMEGLNDILLKIQSAGADELKRFNDELDQAAEEAQRQIGELEKDLADKGATASGTLSAIRGIFDIRCQGLKMEDASYKYVRATN